MFAAGDAGSSEDEGAAEEDDAPHDERCVVRWAKLNERETRELVHAAKALLDHLGIPLSTLYDYAGISRRSR